MLKLKYIIALLLFVYLFGGIYLYIFQRDYIYFNTDEIEHNAKTEIFNIQNEKIKVIVLNKNKENAIIYFPGRSETVAKSIDILKNTFSQYTIYLVNYRGYGGSTGTPTQDNLFYDAKFIYKEVKKRHENISLIGRSLGTGIAAYLAANEKVSKLILTTPYDSILNMAKDKYPFYPLDSIMKDPYNTHKLANKINIPILILLASKDETISQKYSDNLIKSFKNNTLTVVTIEDSGHGSIIDKKDYYTTMSLFLK